MKSLEESIANSLDCEHLEILPFLPYILQDFEELGTASETIIELIKKHKKNHSQLKVLDLGCGKGAVSIKISLELNCNCFGIDAVKEFITEAKNKAKQYNIDHICKFEVNDIRESILTLPKFDIIILGSIGPVFGNYSSTLSRVSKCLNDNGILLIDDGYINEKTHNSNSLYERRIDIINYSEELEIPLIDELVLSEKEEIHNQYDKEYENIVKRCNELVIKYPSKSNLFIDYCRKQKDEYNNLKNNFICSTMVFQK